MNDVMSSDIIKECDLVPLQKLICNTLESKQVLNTLHLNISTNPNQKFYTNFANSTNYLSPERSKELLNKQITCSPLQRVSLFFQSDPEKKRLDELKYKLQNYSAKLNLFQKQIQTQLNYAETIFRQNSTIICPRRIYQLQLWGRLILYIYIFTFIY